MTRRRRHASASVPSLPLLYRVLLAVASAAVCTSLLLLVGAAPVAPDMRLTALSFDAGVLEPPFSPDVNEYTLTFAADDYSLHNGDGFTMYAYSSVGQVTINGESHALLTTKLFTSSGPPALSLSVLLITVGPEGQNTDFVNTYVVLVQQPDQRIVIDQGLPVVVGCGVTLLVITGMYVLMRQGMPGCQEPHRSLLGMLMDIFPSLLCLFDFVTDLVICAALYRHRTELGGFFFASALSLILSSTINCMVMGFQLYSIRSAIFWDWFRKTTTVASVGVVCSLANVGFFRVFWSGALNKRVFSAPVPARVQASLQFASLCNNVLEDLPQIVLQVLLALKLKQWTTVSVISLLISILCLLIGVVKRVFGAIAFRRSSGGNRSGESNTAEVDASNHLEMSKTSHNIRPSRFEGSQDGSRRSSKLADSWGERSIAPGTSAVSTTTAVAPASPTQAISSSPPGTSVVSSTISEAVAPASPTEATSVSTTISPVCSAVIDSGVDRGDNVVDIPPPCAPPPPPAHDLSLSEPDKARRSRTLMLTLALGLVWFVSWTILALAVVKFFADDLATDPLATDSLSEPTLVFDRFRADIVANKPPSPQPSLNVCPSVWLVDDNILCSHAGATETDDADGFHRASLRRVFASDLVTITFSILSDTVDASLLTIAAEDADDELYDITGDVRDDVGGVTLGSVLPSLFLNDVDPVIGGDGVGGGRYQRSRVIPAFMHMHDCRTLSTFKFPPAALGSATESSSDRVLSVTLSACASFSADLIVSSVGLHEVHLDVPLLSTTSDCNTDVYARQRQSLKVYVCDGKQSPLTASPSSLSVEALSTPIDITLTGSFVWKLMSGLLHPPDVTVDDTAVSVTNQRDCEFVLVSSGQQAQQSQLTQQSTTEETVLVCKNVDVTLSSTMLNDAVTATGTFKPRFQVRAAQLESDTVGVTVSSTAITGPPVIVVNGTSVGNDTSTIPPPVSPVVSSNNATTGSCVVTAYPLTVFPAGYCTVDKDDLHEGYDLSACQGTLRTTDCVAACEVGYSVDTDAGFSGAVARCERGLFVFSGCRANLCRSSSALGDVFADCNDELSASCTLRCPKSASPVHALCTQNGGLWQQAKPCPIDCYYEYGPWTSCSRTCGTGTSTRTYTAVKSDDSTAECPTPIRSKSCYIRSCTTSTTTTTSSGCFTGNSMVRMADDSLRPLYHVKAGDSVAIRWQWNTNVNVLSPLSAGSNRTHLRRACSASDACVISDSSVVVGDTDTTSPRPGDDGTAIVAATVWYTATPKQRNWWHRLQEDVWASPRHPMFVAERGWFLPSDALSFAAANKSLGDLRHHNDHAMHVDSLHHIMLVLEHTVSDSSPTYDDDRRLRLLPFVKMGTDKPHSRAASVPPGQLLTNFIGQEVSEFPDWFWFTRWGVDYYRGHADWPDIRHSKIDAKIVDDMYAQQSALWLARNREQAHSNRTALEAMIRRAHAVQQERARNGATASCQRVSVQHQDAA